VPISRCRRMKTKSSRPITIFVHRGADNQVRLCSAPTGRCRSRRTAGTCSPAHPRRPWARSGSPCTCPTKGARPRTTDPSTPSRTTISGGAVRTRCPPCGVCGTRRPAGQSRAGTALMMPRHRAMAVARELTLSLE
jgi:hypothetical protein